MTTPDAPFLAAIRAAPDDDLPRLAYADWLRENGASERADFIEVQVELERIDPKRRTFFTEEEEREALPPLNRREQELWAAAVESEMVFGWFPVFDHTFASSAGVARLSRGDPDTYDMLGQTAIVRRGFVAEVRCRLADWCGGESRGICPRCIGEGDVRFACVRCGGDGLVSVSTPCIGPAVVRSHPVECVQLTDVAPDPGSGGYWYWSEEWGEHLPDAGRHLWELLWVTFDSPEEAAKAMSDALIAWALAQPAEQTR